MSKLKNPLLSLGAKGTIADTLTFQKRGQTTMVREKPIPAYRRTLPQVYQRWLYEDYAYLWTQQTAVIKRQCAATGSRFHLTGFQYWMKLMLATLPDIAGMWHLDEKSGTIAKDFSRNANNGTIYGASPAVGIIDYARSFDGNNDYINFGNSPIFNFTSGPFTIEFILKALQFTMWEAILSRGSYAIDGWQLWLDDNLQRLVFCTYPLGTGQFTRSNPYSLNVWNTWHITRSGSVITIHRNGVNDTSVHGTHANPATSSRDLIAAVRWEYSDYAKMQLDNLIIYNRALDATEILRHSKRRYPA